MNWLVVGPGEGGMQVPIHFEHMDVFMVNKVDRRLLIQSPEQASGGDRRGREGDMSRH